MLSRTAGRADHAKTADFPLSAEQDHKKNLTGVGRHADGFVTEHVGMSAIDMHIVRLPSRACPADRIRTAANSCCQKRCRRTSIGNAPPFAPDIDVACRMTAHLTRVSVLFLRDRANDRLRFGKPAAERRIDGSRAIAMFAPKALFGYVRWRANGFGTELWRAYVLRAGVPGQSMQSIPGIAPGADILVSAAGAATVKRLLTLIDRLEAAGIAPADIPEQYWRTVQNRLAAGHALRVYTVTHHDDAPRSNEPSP